MSISRVLVLRALSLTVLGLAGIIGVIYVTTLTGGVREKKIPRADSPTTWTPDCQDHLINGFECAFFPDICSDPVGMEVCQKTCNVCGEGTTSSNPRECKDQVDSDVACVAVPGFCNHPFAHLLCPKHCGFCVESSTTATTIQPPQTSMPQPRCIDHVGKGFRCSYLPGTCGNHYVLTLCPQHCSHCTPGPEDITPPQETFHPDLCVDYVVGDYSCQGLLDICNDPVARLLCKRHCGMCTEAPSTTTPTTMTTTIGVSVTEPPCGDHLVNGHRCPRIPGICQNSFGRVVCHKFCTNCASSSTQDSSVGSTPSSGTCMDYVGNGMTCQDLPNVCSDPQRIGPHILCPKTCGTCQSVITTLPVPTMPADLDSCHDHLIHDVLCTMQQGQCGSNLIKVICPRTCGLCSGTGPNVELLTPKAGQTCFDWVGAGLDCRYIPGVCVDSHTATFCQLHCGKCPTTAQTIGNNPSATVTTPAAAKATSEPATAVTSIGGETGESGTITSGSSAGCQDNLGNGLSCSSYVHACDSQFAVVMCPMTCNKCGGYGTPATTAVTSSSKCMDNVTSNVSVTCQVLKDSGFCNDTYSQIFCSKTCGHCTEKAITTPSTASPATTMKPPTTAMTSPATAMTSPKTAMTSTAMMMTPQATAVTSPTITTIATTTQAPCVDLVNTCSFLIISFPTFCSDSSGQQTCPKSCGVCYQTSTDSSVTPTTTTSSTTSTSTLTTTTCKPLVSNDCFDEADESICRLPNYCRHLYAQVVCRKTCHFCEDGCFDHLRSPAKCSDLYGPGKVLTTLAELCSHPLAASECEATCGCRGFCSSNSTSSGP